MAEVSPIKSKKKLNDIKIYLRGQSPRDYLLFMVGLSSALRISDILKLKMSDILNINGNIKERVIIHEKKTGKSKQFVITKNLKQAIKEYLDVTPNWDCDDYIFQSRVSGSTHKPLSRIRAYTIIRDAARAVGIDTPIGTHTMRKTWGYHAHKQGAPLALIMQALNHSSIQQTLRYIGITQDDLDDIYSSLNL